jgi:hypothetical protein
VLAVQVAVVKLLLVLELLDKAVTVVSQAAVETSTFAVAAEVQVRLVVLELHQILLE